MRPLTPRQVEIVTCISEGMTTRQIAEELGISHHTVRTHVQNIMWRMGVHTRLQVVVKAIKAGEV